ncbi:MAG TPA: NAD(P)/FAD-dependent oxidoreductase [Blastocatellia bacterium]
MSNNPTQANVCIVGAGLGGSLLAIYLARQGYQVEVYERRPDMRKEPVDAGRSINMTLAARGLQALAKVGLLESVLDQTTPLKGRMIHAIDGAKTFQPYGKNKDEVIYSIVRNKLNIKLLDAAEALPNVELFFNHRCLNIDKESGTAQMRDEKSGQSKTIHPSFIIGADGAFSTVRQQMHKGVRAYYQQEFLDWGYKELHIPSGVGGGLEDDALHIWPRGDFMLLAMPNRDRSVTCACILPFEGDPSFGSLKTEKQIIDFFAEQFPDALPLMPTLAEDFLRNPTVEMITTSTHPWHYKNRIVLIGDACHAVVPFYGQGMNAAFEDCVVLTECVSNAGGDLGAGFARYQELRKKHTDALAKLSKDNFIELRKRVQSPMFVARKKIEVALNRLFPKAWMPLYTMVTHTTIPYAEALNRLQRRNRIARYFGIDILLLLIAGLMVIGRTLGLDNQKNGRGDYRSSFKRPLIAPFTRSDRQN